MDGIQGIAQKLIGKSGNANAPVDNAGVAAIFQALLNKQDQGTFDPVAQLDANSGLLAQDDTNEPAVSESNLDADNSKDDAPEAEAKDETDSDDHSDDDQKASDDNDGETSEKDSGDDAGEEQSAQGDDNGANAEANGDAASDAAVGAAQAQVLKDITAEGPKVGEGLAAQAAAATDANANGQQNGQAGQNAAAIAAAAKQGQDGQTQVRQGFQTAATQQAATVVDGDEGPTQAQSAQTVVKTQGQTQTNGQANAQAQQQQNAAAQRQAQDLANKAGENAKLNVKVTVNDESATQANRNAGLLASASRIALEGPENLRNQIAASSFNTWNSYRGPQGQGATLANGGQGTGPAAQTAAAPVQSQTAPPVEQSSNQALTPTPSPSAPLSQSPTAQQGNPFGVDGLERAATAKSATGAPGPAAPTTPSSSASQAAPQAAAPQPAAPAQTNSAPQSQFAQTVATTTQGAERTQTQGTPVVDQIRVAVTKGAKAGLDRITVQLKPADLGRVEVKLEMGADNHVRVHVVADNKDTLDLMQRDQRGLERALNEAGLRTGSSDIEFSLREEADAQTAQNEDGTGKKGGTDGDQDDTANDNTAAIEDDLYDYAAAAEARGGVDTRV